MLPYILMLVSISFTTLAGTFFHKFSNRGLDNTGDIFMFNGMLSTVWTVSLFVLAQLTGGIAFDHLTITFGLIYAIILCGYQLFKCLAFSTGPISLTTLITCCAFLITTAYAFIFEKESVSTFRLIGIILLLAALFLCINPNSNKENGGIKISAKWITFAFLLFLCNGGVGIVYREFGKSQVSQNATSMLFFASLISAISFYLMAFLTNGITKKPLPKLSKTALKYAVLCGLTGCIYIRMNLSLSAVIPSIIFFPASNGLAVIFSSIVGWFAFKEKLNPLQIFGITLGMAAIVLIGCF